MFSSSSSELYSQSSSSSSVDSSSSSSYGYSESSSSSSVDSSSSSISSSSSSVDSSSSSSSFDLGTLDMRLALVNQGNGDIIPFTLMVERGVEGDGSEIPFIIESQTSSAFKYNNVIDVSGEKEDI